MGLKKYMVILAKDIPGIRKTVLILDELVTDIRKCVPSAVEKDLKQMTLQAKSIRKSGSQISKELDLKQMAPAAKPPKKSAADVARELEAEQAKLRKMESDIKKAYDPQPAPHNPQNFNLEKALKMPLREAPKKTPSPQQPKIPPKNGPGLGPGTGQMLGGGLGPLW